MCIIASGRVVPTKCLLKDLNRSLFAALMVELIDFGFRTPKFPLERKKIEERP